MEKEEVVTQKSPPAIGPYSQAIKVGNLVFCAGQIAADPKTNNLIRGNIKEQTRMALNNLSEVLKTAGTSLNNVVKTTVYLQNMDDFVGMNEVYATYFQKPYPARATIEVAKLPKGALIEIECIAYIKKEAYGGENCHCDCC